MNAREHYDEAERLLEMAQYPQRVIAGLPDPTTETLDQIGSQFGPGTVVLAEPVEFHDMTTAAAHVHATLALAAATSGDDSILDGMRS